MTPYLNLAQDRTAGHTGHASQRILSEGHDRVGLSGEFAFGEFCGLWPDTSIRPGGDKGIDFRVPLRFTVDVKTCRKPYNLIHETGKSWADIYVLAKYDDETGASELLGWEWGSILKRAPTKDFGYGVVSHYIPAGQLRSMGDMAARLT